MLEDSAHIQASDAAPIAKLIARGVDLEPVTPLCDSDGLDSRRGAGHARHRVMPVPVDITFRGMTVSASAEGAVHRWVGRLEHAYGRLLRCSVVIEMPHHGHRQGQAFHVRIQLAVPGRTISVDRDPGLDPTHDDVYVVIADAFRAARRQLQDHAEVRRGDVKQHA